MNMSNRTEDETKKIITSAVHGHPSHCEHRPDIAIGTTTHAAPTPKVSPRENFACVTLVFLEDWQNGRLNSDEVCETLLAAAVARNLITAKSKL
jgi:hypothetical protein